MSVPLLLSGRDSTTECIRILSLCLSCSPFQDASLLRFFVDMRGEDCTNRQLRDDLMTMLIAGHETTAAVLTWVTFQLAQVGGASGP